MSTDLAANLRDTFPGRLLLEWHLHWRAYHPEHRSARAYADSITTEDYSGRVGMTLSSYLYGDGFKDVLDMDTSTAEVVEMSDAITTVLTSDCPDRGSLTSTAFACRSRVTATPPCAQGPAILFAKWDASASICTK